jgi:hypothetical protein
MLATPARPFDSPAYSFEVKWDGVRALAAVEAHRQVDLEAEDSAPQEVSEAGRVVTSRTSTRTHTRNRIREFQKKKKRRLQPAATVITMPTSTIRD